ncbi:phage integrase N-terminal SAM-like domain-containing protein [Bacillus hominis]|uniref:phage integrase N-terminal SAM-like domain-containing protein n=1 Tax=Bacillus hominis TaxID=2817478 RepID=UPI001EE5F743|nr:phage integrase N-terminal SAM-like domain-containing protein [Bacillus hominis]
MKRVKRRAIGKRRDIDTDIVLFKPSITVNRALERVMDIYVSEGYRERTVSDYRMFWAEFINIIDRQLIADVTKDDIRKYVNHLLTTDSGIYKQLLLATIEEKEIYTKYRVRSIRRMKK